MNVKLSISLNEDLAELVKKEAKKTGRSVSEVFAYAIKLYRKEQALNAYKQIASGKQPELFEEAQLEVIRKLK